MWDLCRWFQAVGMNTIHVEDTGRRKTEKQSFVSDIGETDTTTPWSGFDGKLGVGQGLRTVSNSISACGQGGAKFCERRWMTLILSRVRC